MLLPCLKLRAQALFQTCNHRFNPQFNSTKPVLLSCCCPTSITRRRPLKNPARVSPLCSSRRHFHSSRRPSPARAALSNITAPLPSSQPRPRHHRHRRARARCFLSPAMPPHLLAALRRCQLRRCSSFCAVSPLPSPHLLHPFL